MKKSRDRPAGSCLREESHPHRPRPAGKRPAAIIRCNLSSILSLTFHILLHCKSFRIFGSDGHSGMERFIKELKTFLLPEKRNYPMAGGPETQEKQQWPGY